MHPVRARSWAVLLWPISGFGITGGVHRLWAHRSYQANFTWRFFTMLANSIANQGTIYHWARDHRTHHFHNHLSASEQLSTRTPRSFRALPPVSAAASSCSSTG